VVGGGRTEIEAKFISAARGVEGEARVVVAARGAEEVGVIRRTVRPLASACIRQVVGPLA
jgi:hypothetical protein